MKNDQQVQKDVQETKSQIEKILVDFIKRNDNCKINLMVNASYYTQITTNKEVLTDLEIELEIDKNPLI